MGSSLSIVKYEIFDLSLWKFIWCNEQQSLARIWERLDWAMSTFEWLDLFGGCATFGSDCF